MQKERRRNEEQAERSLLGVLMIKRNKYLVYPNNEHLFFLYLYRTINKIMDKLNKNLNLTLSEARTIYLAVQRMGEQLEKDILKRQQNPGFQRNEEMAKLRSLHELNSKLNRFINEFLIAAEE
jgi:hypothetical protein